MNFNSCLGETYTRNPEFLSFRNDNASNLNNFSNLKYTNIFDKYALANNNPVNSNLSGFNYFHPDNILQHSNLSFINLYKEDDNSQNISNLEPKKSSQNILKTNIKEQKNLEKTFEMDKLQSLLVNNFCSNTSNFLNNAPEFINLYGCNYWTDFDIYNFASMKNSLTQKIPIKTLSDNKYIYVNSRQYLRIIKRREMRKKLNKQNEIHQNLKNNKKKYHFESRHNHAMKRQRGKGGRFLSKNEGKNESESETKSKSNNK